MHPDTDDLEARSAGRSQRRLQGVQPLASRAHRFGATSRMLTSSSRSIGLSAPEPRRRWEQLQERHPMAFFFERQAAMDLAAERRAPEFRWLPLSLENPPFLALILVAAFGRRSHRLVARLRPAPRESRVLSR